MLNIADIGALEFPSFIEATPMAVLVSDSSGKICFVNTQLETTFGYKAHELMGQTVEMLVPHSSRAQHVNQRKDFIKARRSRLVNSGKMLKALHADGHEFYLQIGITTIGDKENTYTAAFIIDVSEKYSQDQRIRQMMESMPFGLLLTDESGTIIMTNAELDRIFGYERNTLIGSPVECLIPERLRTGHISTRKAFSKKPESRKMGSGRDLVAVRRNGLEFPAEISLSPLNDNGEVRMLAVISDITRRKQLESTLRHQSCYDSLTNLPNRNLFLDRLDQACIKQARQNTGFALLMIDLDRFKEVNDSLGHPVGDIVLNEVGQRFERVLRKSDSIARIGGDEFSAVLHNISEAKDAILLAEKLIESLRPPVIADKHALSVGASIGIALCPCHGTDKNTLIAHADFAMYQAKRGVHSVVVDNTPPGQVPAPQQEIATEIEEALQRKELIFYYQPKVNLSDGTLMGVEALIRWVRPNMVVISPIEFIPAIEESPVLEKFTFVTLEMAFSQAKVFQQEGNPLSVAVNLSARMLEHPQLVDMVGVLLKKYAIQPSLIALEITETALVINPIKARNAIEALEKYGVTFSIDDFGAGFTSFKYLKNFHFDEIKIDQEFITALQPESFDATLVQSIAGFCKGLNIRLLAEGIETELVLQLLLKLGCQFGQGYHIARPMPIDEFNVWRREYLKS
tara:strand:- start:8583 stop:10637 length:2055 start_codon:yes stop_codon:yes gene_type:complete